MSLSAGIVRCTLASPATTRILMLPLGEIEEGGYRRAVEAIARAAEERQQRQTAQLPLPNKDSKEEAEGE
jgi:hypothetical protein